MNYSIEDLRKMSKDELIYLVVNNAFFKGVTKAKIIKRVNP